MPRRAADDSAPHPVDIYVGNKVKSRRLSQDLSQDELAKACGITFQQVQKYERGTNRISLSRLTEIAYALKTQLEYFTEGCMTHLPGISKPALKGFSDVKQAAFESDNTSRDEMELLRAYKHISTPKLKKQLLEMAKAMAAAGNDG
jgi:transcriptional regulator with XRE-family HTH domain